MTGPWSIPDTWRWSTMGEIAEVVGGGTPSTDRPEYYGGDIPWITPADLSGYVGKSISAGSRSITRAGLENSGARLMPAGAVLFSSRAPIGYVVVAANPVSTNQGFKSFVLRDGLTSDYVYYYLRRAKQLALDLASGTTFLEISGKKAGQIPIPVPPLGDQIRIVAEIEKHLTRLEVGVGALRRVHAHLKRYRVAVFKAAYEGRLVPTEAELARQEGRPYEAGADLLRRMSPVRGHDRHEATGSQKPAGHLDTSALAVLPEGWEWTTLDAIAEIKGGITKDQKRRPAEPARLVPYLRVANVQRGYLDLEEVKQILATEVEIRDLALKPGDVLFNEGGDRDKLGRGWVWNGEIPECIHQNHVFRARLSNSDFHPKFLSWYANSSGQTFFFEQGKHTTNLASISMTKLRRLPVPVPPAAEQLRIVSEIDRLLSLAGGIEAIVIASLQRADRLHQAILQSAFGSNSQGSHNASGEAAKRDAGPSPPSVANVAETEPHMPTPSNRVESLTQLVELLGTLGGSASPEAFLVAAGLTSDIELFFDLLREGTRTGRLSVPIGHTAAITRGSDAD